MLRREPLCLRRRQAFYICSFRPTLSHITFVDGCGHPIQQGPRLKLVNLSCTLYWSMAIVCMVEPILMCPRCEVRTPFYLPGVSINILSKLRRSYSHSGPLEFHISYQLLEYFLRLETIVSRRISSFETDHLVLEHSTSTVPHGWSPSNAHTTMSLLLSYLRWATSFQVVLLGIGSL